MCRGGKFDLVLKCKFQFPINSLHLSARLMSSNTLAPLFHVGHLKRSSRCFKALGPASSRVLGLLRDAIYRKDKPSINLKKIKNIVVKTQELDWHKSYLTNCRVWNKIPTLPPSPSPSIWRKITCISNTSLISSWLPHLTLLLTDDSPEGINYQ